MNWEKKYEGTAIKQGWNLFNTDEYGLTIQKVDFSETGKPKFKTDLEAFRYILTTLDINSTGKMALQIMLEQNPQELRIMFEQVLN